MISKRTVQTPEAIWKTNPPEVVRTIHQALIYSDGKYITISTIATTHGISEEQAGVYLDWLSSNEREYEPYGKFSGVHMVFLDDKKGGGVAYARLPWGNEIFPSDQLRAYDYRATFAGGEVFSPKMMFYYGNAWIDMLQAKCATQGITHNGRFLIAQDGRDLPPEIGLALAEAARVRGLKAVLTSTRDLPAAVSSYSVDVRVEKPAVAVFLTASHVSRPKGEMVVGAKVSLIDPSGELFSISAADIQESGSRVHQLIRDRVLSAYVVPDAQRLANSSVNHAEVHTNMARLAGLAAALALGDTLTIYEVAKRLDSATDFVAEIDAMLGLQTPSDMPLSGLNIVVDGANTRSGILARNAFVSLGANADLINGNIVLVNGEHIADPANPDNLINIGRLRKEFRDIGCNIEALIDALIQNGYVDDKGDKSSEITDLNNINPALLGENDRSIIGILNRTTSLIARMKETGAHMGMAFDLDGDRGAVVVPNGDGTFSILAPDLIVQSLIPFLSAQGGYSQAGENALVKDVLSTQGVNVTGKKMGWIVHTTDAGYPYLKAVVKRLKGDGITVPMYGEGSGHTWSHLTGAYENPIIVGIMFATMCMPSLKKHNFAVTGITDAFDRATPDKFVKAGRFQPLFGDRLLQMAADDSRNTTGWKPGDDDDGPIPQVIINYGRDLAIETLKGVFTVGKQFATSIGTLQVSAFVFDHDGDINRCADIHFTLNGEHAGSFVFRASSNDPTLVCVFETPILADENPESDSLKDRFTTIGGLVMDEAEKLGLANTNNVPNSPNKNMAFVQELVAKYRIPPR